MRRYLFGPVSKTFAEQNLSRQRETGECLAFDSQGTTDLAIGPQDTWAQVCAHLPAGWRPDFVVLYLPYSHIPNCLWTVQVPLVGLALDWPLLWHYYRRRLRALDLVLTDPFGLEVLGREGIHHVRTANLHGCERRFVGSQQSEQRDQMSEVEKEDRPAAQSPLASKFNTSAPESLRDIDILFVGNLNSAVQPERMPILGRLARFGRRWRVSIQSGVFGDAYYRLLCRARIVVNFVSPPRCSRRIFESANAGALLFENVANREITDYFHDRQECILYDSDNLEPLLEHYLENESERRQLAGAAQVRARAFTFENIWGTVGNQSTVGGNQEASIQRTVMDLIDQEWPALVHRAGERASPGKSDSMVVRTWQAINAPIRSDPFLVHDLEAALTLEPGSAQLRQALGLALTRLSSDPTAAKKRAEVAAAQFRQIVAANPTNVPARLNLAEALVDAECKAAAIQEAQQGLGMLERVPDLDPLSFEAGLFHSDFGVFRLEWERAAWTNAGRPTKEMRAKRDLLRWRFHALLGMWTGRMVHYYEAYLARPDLPAGSSALGCKLAASEHTGEALPYLRRGLAENPLDRDAARALHHALFVAQDRESARELALDRRMFSHSAPQAVPAESWFSYPPPSVQDLSSIIILCCNQLELTRQCLEGVWRHSRIPYELILVDNGSTDGTREYLEKIQSLTVSSHLARNGHKIQDAFSPKKMEPSEMFYPVRVEVIRNETNRGFPVGCNQAFVRARGRFLIFLNNDTIVTSLWLETMVARCLEDWPNVGLVGPVSNNAPDVQGIAAEYQSVESLPAFAERRRCAFSGRTQTVRRLTGFCLLVRREVFDRVGRFDERFGMGFFDDDDICLRAREAGFRLVVALDVYIHHFGNQTFKSLGLDTHQLLLNNFKKFRDKWGEEHTAGYRLMGPPPKRNSDSGKERDHHASRLQDQKSIGDNEKRLGQLSDLDPHALFSEFSSTAQSQPSIPASTNSPEDNPRVTSDSSSIFTPYTSWIPGVSLCMIVKNEESNLGPCLDSAADLFDEIIIVDTGSTDRTREIAARYGARLAEFPWSDSFSAARNEGLGRANRRWVMWLDADDRLDNVNRERLREVFLCLGDEKDAYAMKVRSVLDQAGTSFRLLDQVRLFPNHPKVRWDYRVHEQTLPAVLRIGGRVRWTDVIIDHVGYQRAEARLGKLQRNLHLLELDNTDRPDDPFTLFNLGWTLLDLGKTEEALPRLKRSLEKSAPDSSITRKLYHLLALTHRQLGQKQLALAICRDGLQCFPNDTELLAEEALVRLDTQDFARAEANLLQLVESRPGQYFGSVDDGTRGYRTRDLLARQYRGLGRLCEAEIHWRTATAERSSFLPAWLGLGDLLLGQKRHQDLERLAGQLEKEPGGEADAAILRARAHRDREEFPQARRILDAVIARAPGAEGPLILLSHVLLQEGRDLAAAEDALRRIIRLNPNNSEALHNLRVLLAKQGRAFQVEPIFSAAGEEDKQVETEPCLVAV